MLAVLDDQFHPSQYSPGLNDVPKGYLYLSNITNTSRKPNGRLTDVYKTNLSHLPANQIEQVNLYLVENEDSFTYTCCYGGDIHIHAPNTYTVYHVIYKSSYNVNFTC